MAKLTREQIEKWNAGNKNGFQFDAMYYLTHSEKTVKKSIQIGDNHVIICQLMYFPEYQTNKNVNGCTWKTETGRQIPMLHMAKSIIKGDFLVSHGLGYWHPIGQPLEKKNYKVLQDLTNNLEDATCLAIFEKYQAEKVNQYA